MWRASPAKVGFGFLGPLEEALGSTDDAEFCNSRGGPDRSLEDEPRLRSLRRDRSPALIAILTKGPRTDTLAGPHTVLRLWSPPVYFF